MVTEKAAVGVPGPNGVNTGVGLEEGASTRSIVGATVKDPLGNVHLILLATLVDCVPADIPLAALVAIPERPVAGPERRYTEPVCGGGTDAPVRLGNVRLDGLGLVGPRPKEPVGVVVGSRSQGGVTVAVLIESVSVATPVWVVVVSPAMPPKFHTRSRAPLPFVGSRPAICPLKGSVRKARARLNLAHLAEACALTFCGAVTAIVRMISAANGLSAKSANIFA